MPGWPPRRSALASMAVVRADDWLVTLDLLLAVALAAEPSAAWPADGSPVASCRESWSWRSVPLPPRRSGRGASFRRRAPGPPDSATATHPLDTSWGRLRRLTPLARGLAIALPIVAVFVALFASADAVFARLTSDVLAWQPDVDLEDLLVRFVVVTVVAWGAAGLLGLAAGLLPGYAADPPCHSQNPMTAPDRRRTRHRQACHRRLSRQHHRPPHRCPRRCMGHPSLPCPRPLPQAAAGTRLGCRPSPLPGCRSRAPGNGHGCALAAPRPPRSWSWSMSCSPPSLPCNSPTSSAVPTRWPWPGSPMRSTPAVGSSSWCLLPCLPGCSS